MRARYGASPLHLLAHLAVLALVAWALLQVADRPDGMRIVIWLALSAVVHDLVLLPFYGLLDRAARRATPRAAINYVRVPALLSGLLALVFFPVISGKGEPSFTRASGLTYDGYLARWLLITAALFAVSGAVYLLKARRAGSRHDPGRPRPARRPRPRTAARPPRSPRAGGSGGPS
jgi:hypothetical protein